MEVRNYLGRITFDFSRANALRDDDHERAFLEIFQYVFRLFLGMIADSDQLELFSTSKIVLPVEHCVEKKGKAYIYRFFLEDIDAAADVLAAEIYRSEGYEVTIRSKGAMKLDFLVSSDPVFFSIERVGN